MNFEAAIETARNALNVAENRRERVLSDAAFGFMTTPADDAARLARADREVAAAERAIDALSELKLFFARPH